jgi:phosphoenolpyruvate carboxykinase (ATP)
LITKIDPEATASLAGNAQQPTFELGLINPGPVYANFTAPRLVELALERGEGLLTANGALVAYTGSRTGRSPKDRYLVADAAGKNEIWWGPVNREMEPAVFNCLFDRARSYFQGREVFVTDAIASADPRHELPVRLVADKAWHALFTQCLLRPAPIDPHALASRGWTIYAAAEMRAEPAVDGTRSEVFIVLNFARRIVLVGGTHYAGEIKKAVFSILNCLLPRQGVFPMHCSANIGRDGDTALFFGLSGTGKTTLSADPERHLIGDDEHGWSDEGVFNIEAGCYAKCIHLSEQGEPQIWNAIRFGSVLENVVINPESRQPDFDDEHYTENTRAAYPLDFIANAELSRRGGHPRTILLLTCDAFGVLPPLSRLTTEQALYHFLSGYTAKVAGTETGVTEPQPEFSTCFAAPFLPLHPARYAEMLDQRLRAHGSRVWLVNTGWSGGPVSIGERIKLAHTRAMVRAALTDACAGVGFVPDPVFGVLVPETCPGVPAHLLRARETWSNPAAYDDAARRLAALFHANFKNYAAEVPEAVRNAGPRS